MMFNNAPTIIAQQYTPDHGDSEGLIWRRNQDIQFGTRTYKKLNHEI